MYLPHCVSLRAEGANPSRQAWVLHGILGSGGNLRSFARKLVQQLPAWELLLVDLRNHGDSGAAPEPQTVTACAEDLLQLAQSRGIAPQAALGHSFGGKVALRWAQLAEDQGLTPPRVWVLDATPGPLDPSEGGTSDVAAVVGAVRQLPQPLSSREQLVDLLTARGFDESLARWMTTNLRHTPDGLRWRFQVDAVSAMLMDYAGLDLWPYLLNPNRKAQVDVVAAERSDRWSRAELSRFEGAPPGLRLHRLEEAGHWVHVDNPEGLLRMIVGQGLS